MIEVEGLRKEFGSLVAVDDLSFRAEPGRIFGLLGPNGAGKSTTIGCISGLLQPTAGRVRILGHDVGCGRGSVARVHGADPVRMATELQPLDLNEDPWISRAIPRLATGRVFNTEDLLPNARMQRTDAFNAYYRQFGVEQQVAAVGHYDGGNSITLSICRDDPRHLFDEDELGLFQRWLRQEHGIEPAADPKGVADRAQLRHPDLDAWITERVNQSKEW